MAFSIPWALKADRDVEQELVVAPDHAIRVMSVGDLELERGLQVEVVAQPRGRAVVGESRVQAGEQIVGLVELCALVAHVGDGPGRTVAELRVVRLAAMAAVRREHVQVVEEIHLRHVFEVVGVVHRVAAEHAHFRQALRHLVVVDARVERVHAERQALGRSAGPLVAEPAAVDRLAVIVAAAAHVDLALDDLLAVADVHIVQRLAAVAAHGAG